MSSAEGKVRVVGENVQTGVWEDGVEGGEKGGKETKKHGMTSVP